MSLVVELAKVLLLDFVADQVESWEVVGLGVVHRLVAWRLLGHLLHLILVISSITGWLGVVVGKSATNTKQQQGNMHPESNHSALWIYDNLFYMRWKAMRTRKIM